MFAIQVDYQHPDSGRASALSEAVDDVVDAFELDDDLLDQLVATNTGVNGKYA